MKYIELIPRFTYGNTLQVQVEFIFSPVYNQKLFSISLFYIIKEMTDYDEMYLNQTQKFSDLVAEANELAAAEMVADLWEERDYFDHSVDDDLAVLLFAEKGNKESLLKLLDLGADPSTYDNAAIKLAAQNGHTDIVLELAKDDRVDPLSALEFVQGPGRDLLKLAIVKQISSQGDDETLQVLLNDPEFRIDGVMDVLQPEHKRKYGIKMVREVSRAFKPVRQQLPLEVVSQIITTAYDIPALSLYEIIEIMKE